MDRKHVAILCTLLLLLTLPASVLAAEAEATTILPLSLCCTGEVYAVDLVYAISGQGEIADISLTVSDCLFDWNVKEGCLYLALAASTPLAPCAAFAQVSCTGVLTLTPISLLLNAQSAELSHLSHGEAIPMEERAPTCDTPGAAGGSTCAVCGAVLEQCAVLPALGPSATAELSETGELTVSAVLSDDAVTGNIVLLAVYSDGRMVCCEDVSDQPQNELSFVFSGIRRADGVKFFRLTDGYNPRYDVVTAAVAQPLS